MTLGNLVKLHVLNNLNSPGRRNLSKILPVKILQTNLFTIFGSIKHDTSFLSYLNWLLFCAQKVAKDNLKQKKEILHTIKEDGFLLAMGSKSLRSSIWHFSTTIILHRKKIF